MIGWWADREHDENSILDLIVDGVLHPCLPHYRKDDTMIDRAMWQVNREHHSELIEVTRTQQLIKKPKAKRGPFRTSLFVNVTDQLASFRLRLKTRPESIP